MQSEQMVTRGRGVHASLAEGPERHREASVAPRCSHSCRHQWGERCLTEGGVAGCDGLHPLQWHQRGLVKGKGTSQRPPGRGS